MEKDKTSDLPVPATVDEYVAGFSPDIQSRLAQIRMLIHDVVPEIKEKIAYQMPAFYLQKNLVYVAAFKKHIGFFPSPAVIEAFAKELAEYHTSKGTIQFPYNKPLPVDLIKRMLAYKASLLNEQ